MLVRVREWMRTMCHVAKCVFKMFIVNGVEILLWLESSLDLNQIENVWHYVKGRVQEWAGDYEHLTT